MGLRERLQTAQHRGFGLFERLVVSQTACHHGLHNGKQVLCSMSYLASQQV
jgi:hypothetical protein